jgi:RNAse (barnase) inhibitor barstar
MAFFKNDNNRHQRLDWNILQNGWINLYWREELLTKDIQWFQQENFKVVEIDCVRWTTKEHIHEDLKQHLDFPDYYGKNLDAFNDCLYSIDIDDTTGFVVALRNFQHVEKSYGYQLLDILACNSRGHILFGKKLITLVQVDDPHYEVNPVGAMPVLWNPAEWLNSSRVL